MTQLKHIKSFDDFVRSEHINEFVIHGKSSNRVLIFDIDDTLIKSDAKVYVMKGGEVVRKLDSQEFNSYRLGKGESFSFSEFEDLEVLMRSELKPYFKTMEREYRKGVHISILTARSGKEMIRKFFMRRADIDIHPELVFTVGDDKSDCTVAEKKGKCIKTLVDYGYKTLIFFDDNLDNLMQVKKIGDNLNVKTHIIQAV